MLSQRNPYNQGVTYTYDKTGHIESLSEAHGSTTLITTNASGLPQRFTDAKSAITSLEYDKANRLRLLKDANGHTLELAYDALGRIYAQTDGEGNKTTLNYKDTLINKVEYPTFNEELHYDKRNRVKINKRQANSKDYIQTLGYDLVGNVNSEEDALKNATAYQYDALERLKSITDANQGITTFTYDARDNLIKVEDPENRITEFTYNLRNETLSEIKYTSADQTSAATRTYHYDDTGNLIQVETPEGEKTQYQYDNANRMVKLLLFANLNDTAPIKEVTYHINDKSQYTGYTQITGKIPSGDNAGQPSPGITPDILPISETNSYNELNQLTQVIVNFGSFEKTYAYSYYPNGLRQTYTNPEGITYTYYYNKNNQLQAVQIPGTGQISYTNFHWLVPQTLLLPGGNKITLKYDDFMQVKERILSDNAEENLAQAIYEYDLANQIKQINTEHGTYDFDYDALYRLTKADYPDSNNQVDEGFNYDGVGNRTQLLSKNQEGEFSLVTNTLDYNQRNQLTQQTPVAEGALTYSYNQNGHTTLKQQGTDTTEYLYNKEERLTQVKINNETVAQYAYNPYGQRIKKNANNQETWYLYNQNGLAAEYSATGEQIKEYHFHPQATWMTDPLFQRDASGEVVYYQNDHLGTPQRMVKANGAVVWEARYSAFGEAEIVVEVVENNLRFAGQYFDRETKLHHNFHRDYNPLTGRFIQSDPTGINDGPNIYLYAHASPLVYTDPLGLFGWRDAASMIPVLGSGLDAYDAFKCGNIGMGILNLGLAALDLTGVGGLVKGAVVGGFKWSQRRALKGVYKPFKNGRSKNPKWDSVRGRMQTAGVLSKGAVTHHWLFKQAGGAANTTLNRPWNLMPDISDSAHYLAHHGNLGQKLYHGTPGWMKAGAAGLASFAGGLAVGSGCECQ